MADKAYVQTRDGEVVEIPKSEEKAHLESGDYLPATAADKVQADKDAKNSTFSAKAATAVESVGAGAIDAVAAPFTASARLASAVGRKYLEKHAEGLTDDYTDPVAGFSGRKILERAAGPINSAFSDKTSAEESADFATGQRERAEAHPAIALGGNLVGSVLGGGALARGAGALGAGASEALGGGMAARAAGAVATGAAEGAAYSQAAAADDAYIGNVPLTAEKIVASMGWGALLGGSVSLAAHAASGVLGMVRNGSRGATPLDSPRLPASPADAAEGEAGAIGEEATSGVQPVAPETEPTESVVPESAQPIAPTDTGADATKGNWAPIPGSAVNDVELPGVPTKEPGRISSALRDFSNERALNAVGFKGAVSKKLGRTAEGAMDKIGDLGDALQTATLDNGEKVFQPLQTQGQLRERVGQALDESTQKLSDFRERADKIIEANPHIAPDVDSVADKIEREVIAPIMNHPSSSMQAGAKPIQQFADDVRALKTRAEEGRAGTGLQDMTALRQDIDSKIYDIKMGVNIPQMGAKPAKEALEKAKWILEDAITAASDKAAALMPKAEQAGYKELKTNYHLFRTLNDQAGAEELQSIGRRIGSPSDYGAGIAGAAMGGGPIGALGAMAANKLVREHASSVAAVLAKKLAETLDGKIDSGLGSFFRESGQRASVGMNKIAGLVGELPSVPLRRLVTPAAVDSFSKGSKDLPAAYEKRVQELTDSTRDGGSGVRNAIVKAMGDAGDSLPHLTAAATMTATAGANYLQSQLPSGTFAPTVFQPMRRLAPSDLQIREFAQKWATVANPMSVVDDLRRGTVTHAQIDALKAVYPELYAQVQQTALEKIRAHDAAGKRMAFNDRLALDLFLDLNGAGEPTLAGQFVDHVVGLQEKAAAAQPGAQGAPNSGKAVTGLAEARKSPSQTTLGT